MTAVGAVFPWLEPEASELRALVLDEATLDSDKLDARIAGALQDITFERTIEGASTVSMILIDPEGDLLDSGLFSAAVDFELPAPNGRFLGYRLVALRPSSPVLTAEFEDREVARMRGHKAVRKASRADMTRAQFVRMLVRAVGGITFSAPELTARQPIATEKEKKTPKAKTDDRDPGLGTNDVTVKGKKATSYQRRLLEIALDNANQRGDGPKVMIGLVEAMTQESVVHNDFGNHGNTASERVLSDNQGLVNVGVLHQTQGYWPATRDVVKDTTPFLQKLRASIKANPGKSIGWNVDQVQRSYTVDTPRQGADYDQWEEEARKTVAAYTGNEGLTGGAVSTNDQTSYRKRYEFRTTDAGAEKKVDWWTATGSLAEEVQFRRFMDLGTFYYVSDERLIKQAAVQSITRGTLPAGVLAVRPSDFDVAKKASSIEVDVFIDVLEPRIGSVWVVHGYGPFDGRYLVTRVRGSYLRPKATLTLESPRPVLPEPSAETGTLSKGDPTPTGRLPTGMTAKEIIDSIVIPIANEKGISVTASEVEAANARHSTLVAGGQSVSWHKGPPSVKWAADLSNNWAATHGSPEMTATAKALAARFKCPNWPGSGVVTWDHGEYRYQMLYLTNIGGNHFNHVHFGVYHIPGGVVQGTDKTQKPRPSD